MAATPEQEGMPEKAAKLYRNWNILGAVALGGLAIVVPVGGAALGAWAGLNAVQAGGGEVARRWAKKRRLKKGQ
jgi:hypothetical protein